MPSEDDLRHASAEALLERHVGAPLRELAGEVLPEVAERIATAVAELDALIAQHGPTAGQGYIGDDYGDIDPACALCGNYDEYAVPWPCNHHTILTRIRNTLTGGTDHANH